MQNKIGDNIKNIRKAKGMTQKEVASLSKISVVAYCNIERNKAFPKNETIEAIATSLGVLVRDIWQRKDNLKDIRFRVNPKFLMREQIIIEAQKWLDKRNSLDKILHNNLSQNAISDLKNVFKISNKEPKEVAKELRKKWELASSPIFNIFYLLESKGIKVYPYKVKSELFSGMSIGENSFGPAIVFNSWEGTTVERQIFSIAHELGHLILHQNSFDYNIREISENEEKQADIFASYFLMPDNIFTNIWKYLQTDDFVTKIILIKRFFKVSWKTIVYRLTELTQDRNWWKKMYILFKQQGYNVGGHREPKPLNSKVLFEDSNPNFFIRKQVMYCLYKNLIRPKEATNYLEVKPDQIEKWYNHWKESLTLSSLQI